MMDRGAYDEEYALDDGDEYSSLLQDSGRQTPPHINSYFSQMERMQRERKLRRQMHRYLAMVFGVVALSGWAWTQNSHVELTTTAAARLERVDHRPSSSFCESRQCIDFIPRSKLDDTCEAAIDPQLFHALAKYVFETSYTTLWSRDPTLQCTQPKLVNYSATAASMNGVSCAHYAQVVDIEAVGLFTADGAIERAVAKLTSVEATERLDPEVVAIVAHVGEKWSHSNLMGIPGLINPAHDERSIWLVLELPVELALTELTVVVNTSVADVLLNTTFGLPADTGLVALRLDRELNQEWPAGEYTAIVSQKWKVSFTVLPNDSRAIAASIQDKFILEVTTPSANKTEFASACSTLTNLTQYCACQASHSL
ncbi:hypothetical protein AC1031_003118 [Aphanomyces cochlioides]|nr:hypothetical protein AC1031_003118 [Aphanomyces cochlioides]